MAALIMECCIPTQVAERNAHGFCQFVCLRFFALPPLRGNTFPAHLGSRYPTIYSRLRCWGTPKYLLLSTIHSRLYPISTSAEKMVLSVRPLSCDNRPRTFSKSKNGGRFSARIRAISKKTVPLVSRKPRRRPATEKLWLFRYRNNQDYAEEIVIPKFELQPNK